ncbi:unnamed protein product [Prorocentrum cordatum]|uniref:Tubulin--tyrosine ligase-like protein 9 n=1 Tax=Prorocentrum cordatum TaxID=2364126 RepID=A0ABN9PFA5_9DINO|nr:unnamed protein product [Polarella glacialis]
MVRVCQELWPEGAWDFNPRTWVLPDQAEQLRETLAKSKRTYIVKPQDGSQGDGIFLVQGVRDLDVKLSASPSGGAVVQRYLERPLLLGGTKFDLRMYVAVIGGSRQAPPAVHLCREGLARFCTERYEEPAPGNMHRCMAHLTNYSLNKRSEKFEHCGGAVEDAYDSSSTASKRPLTVALRQIEAEHPEFDTLAFYDSVATLTRTVVSAMAPAMLASYRGCGADDAERMRCCQLLGFDVMLDRNFRPLLLEINNSPSLCIDEALPLVPGDPRLEERGGIPGRPRERGPGRVCVCMDMAQPHTHQTSAVDLAVKAVAVGGLFRLLEQLNCGEGSPEAFHSSSLRRLLAPACGHQGLEKHDLDTLSQRFRSTRFSGRELHGRPEGLRNARSSTSWSCCSGRARARSRRRRRRAASGSPSCCRGPARGAREGGG